jgi:hypothetical protein
MSPERRPSALAGVRFTVCCDVKVARYGLRCKTAGSELMRKQHSS